MINQYNFTILLPVYNSCSVLDLCLSAFYYYVINPPKIIIIDNASIDGTRELVQKYQDKYNIEYIDCGSGDDNPIIRTSVSLDYVLANHMKTDYFAFMHADVEIIDYGFWDTLNNNVNCDILYTGRWHPYTKIDTGSIVYIMLSGINNHFIVIRKQILDDFLKQGGTLHPQHEWFTLVDGKRMSLVREVFVDLFDWATDNYKDVKQIHADEVMIHYFGLTRLSKYTPDNTSIDIKDLLDFIDTKIEYKNTFGLPYHKHFKIRLKQLLSKRVTY